MNLKRAIILEHIKNDRVITLVLPEGLPWIEAASIVNGFSNQVHAMAKQAEENQKKVESADAKAMADKENGGDE